MVLTTGTIFINLPKNKQGVLKGRTQQKSKEEKIDDLAERAHWIIFEASTLPSFFRPYKDKITICPNRVTISRRWLFDRDEYPMPIENITNASVHTHFLRASVVIETFGIIKPEPLTNLRIDDARLIRRYILALIECKKANIDLSDFDLNSLREKLKEIGTVQHGSEKDIHNL